MNRKWQRVHATACKYTVPQAPDRAAARNPGKHVGGQGKPDGKPTGDRRGIDTMPIRRTKHRHQASSQQSQLLCRRQTAIVPVPSINTEQPVPCWRRRVKRQPGVDIAHRVKAKINRNRSRIRTRHRKQTAIMGAGCRRALQTN